MPPSAVHNLSPGEVFGALALQLLPQSNSLQVHKIPRNASIAMGRTHDARLLIEKLGKSRRPVILFGEPGTRKEVLARAIHDANPVGRFVTIDCLSMVGLPMESELFGRRAKPGLIEAANQGTIFFSGIEAIPINLQAKLLRLLQTKQFERVGSDSARQSSFRVIAGTEVDLAKEVEKGLFDRDLYRYLNAITFRLAPLRESKDDIAGAVNLLLARLGRNHAVTPEAMEAMLSYSWPGNLRELENCVRYALARSAGRFIRVEDLPIAVQDSRGKRRETGPKDLRAESDTKSALTQSRIEWVKRHVPQRLQTHARATFGSVPLATEWFLAGCGALHNRAPVDALGDKDGEREIERILGCIDYGMIA